jgi:leucine dehydrogenase
MQMTEVAAPGYERVVKAVDKASGLHALISIHDTTLGPALGGLRMWPYPSEAEALFDVNRLSKGMTYKSAVAHTGLGGGKSVIIGDPQRIKSEALYLAMGRFVDAMGGRYITAEDVNTTLADLEIVRRTTKWVTGLSREVGGSGNPSPYTAYGVFLGIKAAVEWKLGRGDLKDTTVAVQGVGAVGAPLAERLVEAGARVFAHDRNPERIGRLVKQLGVTPLGDQEVLTQEVDVLAPCALGAVINDDTAPRLRCKIVAGAANNQLLADKHGEMLRQAGILYAPDFVINAGGIINVSAEFAPGGYDEKESLRRIERIPKALHELWAISEREGISCGVAAVRLAEQILAEARAKQAKRPAAR